MLYCLIHRRDRGMMMEQTLRRLNRVMGMGLEEESILMIYSRCSSHREEAWEVGVEDIVMEGSILHTPFSE